MCFSATASFSAAGALAGIGAVSLRSAPSRAHAPLAAVPLVFAAQQLTEGALWLVLRDAPFEKSATPIGRAFLFFALFLWPVYLPAALSLVERSTARRRVLRVSCAAGAALGGYLIACATLRASDACVAFGNIYYFVQIDAPRKRVLTMLYLAAIAGPLVVSSVRGTTLLAIAAAASAALVGALYRAGFVSVWCFFAAALSGVVVLVLRLEARAITDRRPRRRR